MRLHRFYVSKPLGDAPRYTLQDARLIHQWRDVFRMKVGPTSPRLRGARDSVILFDGSGEDFECEIISLAKNEAEMKIIEKKKGIMPEKEIWLFFSLIKKDNVEMVLQKCTEIGVSHFVPVISERSEKKGFNTERAEKILIEASEQCGRSNLPKLHEINSLSDAIKNYKDELDFIAFDSTGISYQLSAKPARTAESNVQSGGSYKLGILVGPEGGFTENELILFKENNIPVYSLCKLTLRAETAAIVASAMSIL